MEVLAGLRAAMAERSVTYGDLAAAVGRSPIYLAAALQGQQRLNPLEAEKLAAALGAGPEAVKALSTFPVRSEFPLTTDPFKYRLLEIVGVYGDALRSMANEMFGDGIMSAIDFTMDVEKVTGKEGEARMKITMNGKWLPYKQF
ncbi:MAG TPA: cyanase [Planctomycetota bacterium]|nr:cyanase [Planctomycetota bacterium]